MTVEAGSGGGEDIEDGGSAGGMGEFSKLKPT